MFQAITPAYVTKSMHEFHSHRTVCFTFKVDNSVSLDRILSKRIGFKQLPEIPKQRFISMHLANPMEWGSRDYADLIVSDDSANIYGYIDKMFYQSKFYLKDIMSRGEELGILITTLKDLDNLTVSQRGMIFTSLLTKLVGQKRKSDQELLGYKRISWDEFARSYDTIITDDKVLAFPKANNKSYYFMGPYNTNSIGAVLFGEHREDGEELAWVIDSNRIQNLFNPKDRNAILSRSDDYEKISNDLTKISHQNSGRMIIEDTTLSTKNAPSLFTNTVKISKYLPERKVDLPELISIARSLNLRGITTKTKAELSIIVGEKLAEQPPKDMQGVLVYEKGIEFDDINDTPDTLKDMVHEPVEYYEFSQRLISHKAYIPNAQASSAGRIPTDGQFNSYIGIEPLDILNLEV